MKNKWFLLLPFVFALFACNTPTDSSTPTIDESTEIKESTDNQNSTSEDDSNHIHDYQVVEVVEATCNNDAYIIYGCKCSETYTAVEENSALGHIESYENYLITKCPTTSSEGVASFICSRCNEGFEDIILPIVNPNNYVMDYLIDNNCEYRGNKLITYTTEDNITIEIEMDNDLLPATHKCDSLNYTYDDTYHYILSSCVHGFEYFKERHTFISTDLPATTTQEGLKHNECIYCDYEFEIITPIVHEHEYTYEQTGNGHKGTCVVTNCNKVIYENCDFVVTNDDNELVTIEKCDGKCVMFI